MAQAIDAACNHRGAPARLACCPAPPDGGEKIVRFSRYALLLLGVFAVAYVFYGQWRTRAPNILLIVVDALRADRLGCYGNARKLTPFVDGLAERGAVFLNAYANSSWTVPSIASLMTSRYPSQHHVVTFTSKLASEEVTLAETLQPLQYEAGGFSANFRLLESLGFAQGFQFWRSDAKLIAGLSGDELREQCLEWLDRAWQPSSAQPAMLYLHYMEPHSPYEPTEPYLSQFARNPDGSDIDKLAAAKEIFSQDLCDITHDDLRPFESLYEAEVAAVDAQIRLLFAELERRRFLDNAITVITADHGEEFWEHGGLEHGRTLHNESIRVPLLLIAPGYQGGQRIEENVSLLDVGPTLLDLLGLPPEPRFEGRSLVPRLKGRSLSARLKALTRNRGKNQLPADVILQLPRHQSKDDKRVHEEGMIRGSLKALVQTDGQIETYDLDTDLGETNANPRALEAEKRMLAEALEEARKDLASRAGVAVSGPPLDEATKEKLRRLGYQP